MKKEEDTRRSFLKHILAGSAAVIGTAAIVRTARARNAAPVNRADETLYQESDDFKKYYKNLRS